MDTVLVVCYSYTGVSRRVAQVLASHHGWQLAEIRDERRRAGGSGTWRCLLDSLLRRKPGILYEGPDPGDFRATVLVFPIWAYRMAGPMRTFVATHADRLQHVAVLTTMGSGGASNAVAEVAQLLGRAPVLSAAVTARELEDGSSTGRVIDFGDAIVPAAVSPVSGRRPAFVPAA